VNELIEMVSRLEQSGGRLELDGDRIRYAIPTGNSDARDMLRELRQHREAVKELLRQRVEEYRPWPAASLDVERRFGQPHAKLFPFLGRKVRTPEGVGTLIQVFADRCTVVLDSQMCRRARFPPIDITPVSWEL
jgi:hypothetical protein